MHNGRPPFQCHHFLAKAVQFYRTYVYEQDYEFLVTDLCYVLTFHESLCESRAAQGDQLMLGHLKKLPQKDRSRILAQSRRPSFAPCLRNGPLPYCEHGFQLRPLFRALVMVVDGHSPDDNYSAWTSGEHEPPPQWGLRNNWRRNPRREQSVDWCTACHSVLLVRTGDDDHLSAPVSFGPLFASHRVLPLVRDECRDFGEDVVRSG
jgi:hypothetical protein